MDVDFLLHIICFCGIYNIIESIQENVSRNETKFRRSCTDTFQVCYRYENKPPQGMAPTEFPLSAGRTLHFREAKTQLNFFPQFREKIQEREVYSSIMFSKSVKDRQTARLEQSLQRLSHPKIEEKISLHILL